MPNGDDRYEQDWELRHEIARLKRELEKCQLDAAKVVQALDRAIQLTEAMLAWMPEGMVLSEQVKTEWAALAEALRALRS
jgi:hypothetical protein